MSVRDLPENRNEDGSRWETDITKIENTIEAKGLDDDVEDIDIIEGTNDSGDDVVTFRIYTDKVLNSDGSVDEESSVGVQVSKMPGMKTSKQTFRNNVQSTLSSLKRYLYSDDEDEEVPEEYEESEDTTETSSTTNVDVDVDGGPGTQLDAKIKELDQRVEELEDKVEELEDYVEALEGLKTALDG